MMAWKSPGVCKREGRVTLCKLAFFFSFLGFAAGIAEVAMGAASAYPTRPVRLLVPFAPGGGSDLVARLITPRLSERLGQPVIVDNRPAASGVLATEMVAKAKPDGYTLLVAMTTQAAFPSLYPKLQFDAVKSFEPVTLVAVSPLVAVVNASFPAKTLQGFIAYARANPGKVNFGSSGTGSPIHLAGELFRSMANIDMAHVVYKGISPAITALMGNEIQILFPAVFLAKPHVNNGRLRALGVTSLKRSELVPDWPTIAESGMPGYESNVWYGIMAPARTDRAVISRLHREIVSILQIPEVKQAFSAQGSELVGSTPEEFAAVLQKDVERLGKLIKERGIRLDQ